MYKFSNADGMVVENVSTGEKNIHPGTWKWEEYQKWVKSGGLTSEADPIEPIEPYRKLVELKEKATEYLFGGVKYLGKWYNTDLTARATLGSICIYALSLMAGGEPLDTVMPGCSIVTLDGLIEIATIRLVLDINRAIVLNDQAIAAVEEKHRDGIAASVNPGTYDLLVGWPVTLQRKEK